MQESQKPVSAASSNPPLPDTLSRRIQFLREDLDLTQRQLARKSQIALSQIQDIEAGLELFLAPSVRLKLARALRVQASVLQEVESATGAFSTDGDPNALAEAGHHLLHQVSRAPEQEYSCPHCQAAIVVRVFERRDLEGNPIQAIKIHCTQCLFQLASE